MTSGCPQRGHRPRVPPTWHQSIPTPNLPAGSHRPDHAGPRPSWGPHPSPEPTPGAWLKSKVCAGRPVPLSPDVPVSLLPGGWGYVPRPPERTTKSWVSWRAHPPAPSALCAWLNVQAARFGEAQGQPPARAAGEPYVHSSSSWPGRSPEGGVWTLIKRERCPGPPHRPQRAGGNRSLRTASASSGPWRLVSLHT